MGYNTRYSLAVDDGEDEKHDAAIVAASGYGILFDGESFHWYSHEEYMTAYSKQHPGAQFAMSGEGEESGDAWVQWFKDGKMQEWFLEVSTPTAPPFSWGGVK
jgi:hypothetical protein